ncbi:hypothetical protein [Methylobacterium sp. CM6247]
MGHVFHPDRPDRCPPQEATEIDKKIYRGIKVEPISDNDFLSHVEADLPKNDPNDCEHWGLSVWASAAEVENARAVHRYMKKWFIAEGHVKPEDGVFLPTPNENHPEHCTFWKAFNRNITGNFVIALQPVVKK